MKKIMVLLAALALMVPAAAQNKLNDNPDSILGEYLIPDPGNDAKCRFTKNADGTFRCQMFWFEQPIDPKTGQPWLDVHNPDKSLRGQKTETMVIIDGLKYNAEKKVWDGAKVYDPNRGIKANVTICFTPDGSLMLKGTVLGIGEKVYWKKLK